MYVCCSVANCVNFFIADIDECVDNTTLCDQICVNTDGSYFCSCMGGYALVQERNQCKGNQNVLYFFCSHF